MQEASKVEQEIELAGPKEKEQPDGPRIERLMRLMPWLFLHAHGRKKERRQTCGPKGAFGGQKAKEIPAERFALCSCGSGRREDRCCEKGAQAVNVSRVA